MYNMSLFVFLFLFSGFSMAADRYINITTPVEYDFVDPCRPLLVSGTGRGLFEGNVVVRIEDPAGEQLLQAPTTMKRGHIAAEGEWQISITLPSPLPETIRLSAFSPSPKEGDPAITSRSILLTTQAQTQSGLDSMDWRLSRYRDASGKMLPVIPDTKVTAQFMDGKLSGGAGCNRYFGSYTTGTDDQLSFSTRIGATLMVCAPPVSGQERQYLNRLSAVVTFQLDGESLRLLDKNHQIVLEYTAAAPLALENTHWQAAGINNGRGGVVSSATTGLATAQFNGGKVSGHAGCNAFSASYEIMGDQITIGPAMTTRKHCAEPDGIMAHEQEYLQALSRARVYELSDSRLKLRDEKGSLQVNFVVGGAERR